jgi:acetolactate synthase I/II/III large subunit
MAEGYAHVTGRPGVAMVTSGPAATNLVTPLMDAYMDSIPMVGITGQVGTAAIGTDAFQECDTVGITRSCTKHNELVMTAEELPMAIRQAFHIATTGRPGPTLVDIPKDVLQNDMTWYWPSDDEVAASLPGYRPNTKGHPRMIKEAARLILESHQPILYIGGGMLKARAAEALRELVELTGIHVVTTLMARGVFPDSHPLNLGMPGMHGNAYATTAMQKSDLLINLGARFDDRITGKVGAFAPDAKIIHVDIDPAEQGKVRRPDVPIVGDCRLVTEELIKAWRPGRAASRAGRNSSRPSTNSPNPERRSSRSTVSSSCATSPRRTPSSRRASASTRCGRRCTGSSSTRTRGSTRAAWARWGSRSPPRSAPRPAAPMPRCGPSTETAASK